MVIVGATTVPPELELLDDEELDEDEELELEDDEELLELEEEPVPLELPPPEDELLELELEDDELLDDELEELLEDELELLDELPLLVVISMVETLSEGSEIAQLERLAGTEPTKVGVVEVPSKR